MRLYLLQFDGDLLNCPWLKHPFVLDHRYICREVTGLIKIFVLGPMKRNIVPLLVLWISSENFRELCSYTIKHTILMPLNGRKVKPHQSDVIWTSWRLNSSELVYNSPVKSIHVPSILIGCRRSLISPVQFTHLTSHLQLTPSTRVARTPLNLFKLLVHVIDF